MNHRITFTAQDLKELATVAVMASTDKARPILTGVLVEWSAEGVTFTATDSYRLAVMTRDGVTVEGDAGSVILSAKALAAAVKDATKGAGPARGYRSATPVTLSVEIDGARQRATLTGLDELPYPVEIIEGTYPPTGGLIPADSAYANAEGVNGIGVNPEFVGSIAKVYPWTEKGAGVKLQILDAGRPIKVTGDYGRSTVLIMPVRIK